LASWLTKRIEGKEGKKIKLRPKVHVLGKRKGPIGDMGRAHVCRGGEKKRASDFEYGPDPWSPREKKRLTLPHRKVRHPVLV